jgi:hypothetical protein
MADHDRIKSVAIIGAGAAGNIMITTVVVISMNY